MKLSTNVHYAGFPKRLAAFALDYLVIMGYVIILTSITLGLTSATGFFRQTIAALANPFVADLLTFLTLVLPVILYFTFQESSSGQATWGKRKVGIKVVNSAGERLSRKQAFVRSLIKFLPWQLAHTSIYHIKGWPFVAENLTPEVMMGLILAQVLVVVYIILLVVDKAHRTPYDWISGASVILAR